MLDIISLLSADGFVVCNKKLIKLYGTDCAVIIGEMCAEYNYYKIQGKLEDDDSFYSTQENIEDNTGINPYFQRKAFKLLSDEGIITVTKKGLPAKNYYKINSEKLAEVFTAHSREELKGLDVKPLDINNNKQIKIKNTYTVSKDTVFVSENSAETSDDVLDTKTEKPKRKNLFQKCIDMIQEYTNDKKLRDVLVQYLELLLEKSRVEGKALYANQFKGMLNKLDEMVENGEGTHYDIVQQSLVKSYIGFFPANKNTKPNYQPDTNKAPQHLAGEKMKNSDGSLVTF